MPLSGAAGMLPLRGRPLVSGAGGTRAALSFLPTPSLAVTAGVDMRGQLSAAIVLALAVAWAVYLVPRGGQQDAEDAALPLLPSPLDAATAAEAPRRMATALTFVSALRKCGRGLVGQLVCNVMVAECNCRPLPHHGRPGRGLEPPASSLPPHPDPDHYPAPPPVRPQWQTNMHPTTSATQSPFSSCTPTWSVHSPWCMKS